MAKRKASPNPAPTVLAKDEDRPEATESPRNKISIKDGKSVEVRT
jgi:hypothetical protein